VTRSALALAALASAAIPGLDPATVEAVESREGQQFELAFVQDTQHRRWVVRAPLTRAAGARMDITVALLGMLARRLPFSVPTPKGFVALKEGGRAAVYPYLAGRPLELTHLPAGPGLAAEIGRAIAALHNVDRQLFDEAGLPSYDADTYRTRRLSELDRAAATGHVPTGLLARWEAALEDVSLWRFAPTPTHGDLGGEQILAVFDDDEDAATGRVRAFTGWEDAKVADPADDFATLVTEASPEAVDSVLEAYAHARVDRPDQHLERRARLAGELRLVSALLAATARAQGADRGAVASCAARLRRLDEHAADHPLTEPKVVPSAPPVASVPPTAPVPPVVVDEPTVAGEQTSAAPGDAAKAVTTGEPVDATVPAHADTAGPTGEELKVVAPDAPEQAEPHTPEQADAPQGQAGSTATGSAGEVAPGDRGDAPAAGQPAPEHHGEDDDLTQPIPVQPPSGDQRGS
jgi:aminoglycoside phosphotransferase (APT) family kinase protein